ncbi:helix-turn-helix transcriptional regulator [Dactylosporangium sp. AC04546]|uniref:helix-turn-helix transcriptional regulator n=1 Tax=Dactylosporangium sp. AC04546 TaxID=2862460 RepID=UPI001EDF5C05|nr:helix-turn-helix transcriptional regulator [Dactylosporangium sp. AC04546]WVK80353.1 helix-turn-helix transcriptional regulator [Dactylosporangium sp. AC04546]
MVDAAALERIRRIAAAATHSRALREAVLAEIGRVVAFAAYVWPLTDPETSVATDPLASIPPALMPDLPRLIRLKYLTPVNRWTGLSGAAHLEVPAESLVWRELLHAHAVTDVASVVFRDRYGCWAFLDLWRCGGAFTRAELAFLDEVATVLTEHVRRCEAATFATTATARDPAPVVLLLDADLRVLGQTSPTHEYLTMLLPPPADLDPVPAVAYNVAAQLVAAEAGVDEQPPMARIHLAGGRRLTLRAARIGPDAQIAVTVEDSSPAERTAVFARACGLAAREAELLQHLTTGADTRTVAARMFLSENTVQDHLKSIFTKTGTRSRRVLLSRATGTA